MAPAGGTFQTNGKEKKDDVVWQNLTSLLPNITTCTAFCAAARAIFDGQTHPRSIALAANPDPYDDFLLWFRLPYYFLVNEPSAVW